ITKWVFGWRTRGWKTATGQDVLNRDLWERLSALVQARGRGGVDWHWVRGHVGTPGNERADAISVAFATARPADLYDGPLDGYGVDVRRVPAGDGKPVSAGKGSAGPGTSKAAAYSYVSVVDGVPMRHATWPECERRVKGRSSARFKKSVSAEDEAAILRGWGVDPTAL
ncbi:MAG: RNase H family protein, partial [Vicinamibacterales bacterium]